MEIEKTCQTSRVLTETAVIVEPSWTGQARIAPACEKSNQDIMASDPESEIALTRAKNAEAALLDEKYRAEQYLNIVSEMLVIVDVNEKITMINRRGREILGYKEGELIGRNWFNTVVPRKGREKKRKVFHTMLVGEDTDFGKSEDLLITKHGEHKMLELGNTLVKDPAGQVSGVLISGEDNTEMRKARELLQHSQLLASLGEMTAGIAHEVNNPLGSILLYSELMMATNSPPEIKQDLKIIHEEAKRATKVMTDLLAYSRREKSSVRRLDLHKILGKMLDMRQYTEKIKNIAAATCFQDSPLCVKGDASHLLQLFMNLMLNAEESLVEAGGGTITVSTCEEGDWAKVSVSDTGVGIPSENLNHVFYPFFTTKRIKNGTGLGLSTCYSIVTDHNGLIHAENNSEGGATFTVELPLAAARKRIRQQQTRGAAMATPPPEYADQGGNNGDR